MIWSQDQIKYIRSLYKKGTSVDELCVQFGLSRAVLTDILCNANGHAYDDTDEGDT